MGFFKNLANGLKKVVKKVAHSISHPARKFGGFLGKAFHSLGKGIKSLKKPFLKAVKATGHALSTAAKGAVKMVQGVVSLPRDIILGGQKTIQSLGSSLSMPLVIGGGALLLMMGLQKR